MTNLSSRSRPTRPGGAPSPAWLVAMVMAVMLASTTAISPMYAVYQARWELSTTVVTAVFAVYSGVVLCSLLLFGTLSDASGRRPPAVVGLLVVVASLCVFLAARNAGWLYGARAAQGLGVGLASAALGALIVDLASAGTPGRRRRLDGGEMNVLAAVFGMAIGGLWSGVALQYVPHGPLVMFVVLVVLLLVGMLTLTTIREPTMARPVGRVAPLHLSRAEMARFAVLALPYATSWAIGGFYLSLGPLLTKQYARSLSDLASGLGVAAFATSGGAALAMARSRQPSAQVLSGGLASIAGLACLLLGISVSVPPAVFASAVPLGIGWGLSGNGSFRAVMTMPSSERRAQFVALTYFVSYCAFSVPALVAGIAAAHVGLRVTSIAFAGAMAAVAALGALAARWLPSGQPAS